MHSSTAKDLQGFGGRIAYPGDSDYPSTISGMQTGVAVSPDVVVEPLDTADVKRALTHASRRGLRLAIRATGHGATSMNGGMLINTARMNHVHIDPDRAVAEVGPGAVWQDVIAAAGRHGLVPLSGTAGTVGVTGYTLGGGLGPLARQHGYAADHVTALDLVTPEGTLRRVTADSEPDLFWAARGAGRYLGIATSLRFRLFPISHVYAGSLTLKSDSWREAMEHYLAWTVDLPRHISSSLSLMNFPDLPGLPEQIRGLRLATIHVSHLGTPARGDELLRPLRRLSLADDTVASMPGMSLSSIFNEPTNPHSYQGDAMAVRDVEPAALDGELAYLASPKADIPTFLFLHHLGGAMAEPATPANAVGHRQARYLLRMVSSVTPEHDADALATEQEGVLRSLVTEPAGRMINFLFGDNATSARLRSCYSPADFDRLTRIKRETDPGNLLPLG